MLRDLTKFGYGQALVEAQRCLSCYQAPCTQACPAGVDIPTFIRRFREGNLAGASQTIYDSCPLGSTCGTACPTHSLCEGACTLHGLAQSPIRIGALQAYITQACTPPETPAVQVSGKRVAVIGAGPAGIGCAVQLHRLGVTVEVFERESTPGGWVTRVIPSHRLPQSAVEVDLRRLSGIPFHYGVAIDPEQFAKILSAYDAVFLGLGMSGENALDLPGLEVDRVSAALPVLESARALAPDDDRRFAGKTVVVVGGGNVALDAAVVARRRGAAQVIVLYRRGKAEMPGWESEYLEACALGVEFRWLSVVDEVISQDRQLRGVRVGRTRYVSAQAGGRTWVEADPSQPAYPQPCDLLITALGQQFNAKLAESLGLATARGLLQTTTGTCQTSNPKVFAAGEAVSGGSTIVACLSAGIRAGREIHQWLAVKEASHA
jgi:glutamate synthase (NADPH/NADH) small chain